MPELFLYSSDIGTRLKQMGCMTVRYARSATLYLTPTDGEGKEVVCRSASGAKVEEITCKGPYKSASDEYDA